MSQSQLKKQVACHQKKKSPGKGLLPAGPSVLQKEVRERGGATSRCELTELPYPGFNQHILGGEDSRLGEDPQKKHG